MAEDTEDDIRPSHFRYARRDETALARNGAVPGNTEIAAPALSTRVQDLSPYVWTAFCVLGVMVIGYLISLVLRSPNDSWTWLDGWTVCAIEGVASVICIVRGLDKNPGRAAPLALGLSLLSWTLGDVFLTIESLGGKTPAVPSIADIFYLGFYPLAYVATVQLLRTAMGRLSRPNWLDGVVAGVGAAALCAAFAFHSILHAAGGSVATAATNLAYPIGDLLLLSLVIGGTVLLSGRSNLPWLLLATGIALNVIGDTANLFSSSTIFASKLGVDFNAVAWPASILLMSMSVWLKPRTLDPLRAQRVAGVVFPSVAAAAALGILLFGYVRHDLLGRAVAGDGDLLVGGSSPHAFRARPSGLDRRASPPGPDRRTDRSRQSSVSLPRARDVLLRLRQSVDELEEPGVPLHRPQPLQGDQRLLRTPGGRRVAASTRSATQPGRAGDRFGLSTGRRRARGGVGRRRRRDGRIRRREHPHADLRTIHLAKDEGQRRCQHRHRSGTERRHRSRSV